jgi:hypothetical protein
MFFSPVRGDWICRPYQLVEWLKWSGTLKITEITARPFFGTLVRNLANTFPLLTGWSGDMCPVPPYRLGLIEERDPSYHDMNQLYMSESGGKSLF